MKKNIFHTILITLIISLMAACGGGGGGDSNVAGSSGTGITAVGTITGFGSIFVNGVEYETNGSTFMIDDNPGMESDLRVGMVVQVEGTRADNALTGTATRVEFDNQLEGPISGAITSSPDGTTKTFSVIGVTVRVSSTGTTFDNSDSLTFANITSGDVVEISGFVDSAGVLNATFIERRGGAFQPGTDEVEARGIIRNLGMASFDLDLVGGSAVTVSFTGGTVLDDLPVGLVNGRFVEVKGTLANGNATVIDATRIEGEGLDDNVAKVSMEGIITDFNGVGDFKVAGLAVNAIGAVLSPANLALGNGAEVEVEGPVTGGVLMAIRVEARGGSIAVHAPVLSVDNANNRLSLDLVQGTVTVNLNSQTRMEDSVLDISPFTIANISAGNFVEIEAYTDGSGNVVATRLKRDSIDDSILQGIVTAATSSGGGAGSVTILGVTLPTTTATTFEDVNDVAIVPKDDFFTSNGGPVGKLVKIKDNDPTNGIADEVEYED